jgi:hypothetical protein
MNHALPRRDAYPEVKRSGKGGNSAPNASTISEPAALCREQHLGMSRETAGEISADALNYCESKPALL